MHDGRRRFAIEASLSCNVPFDLSVSEENRCMPGDQSKFFVDVTVEHEIRPASFVLERDENDAARGARLLPASHEPCNRDARFMRRIRKLRSAEHLPAPERITQMIQWMVIDTEP